MKTKQVFLLLILFLGLFACNNHPKMVLNDLNKVNDSLQEELLVKRMEVEELNKLVPKLLVKRYDSASVMLFQPYGLNVEITHKRPTRSLDNYLCVPASFSSPQNKIVGIFVENGSLISNITDEITNGVCVITNNDIEILPTNKYSENNTIDSIDNNYSLFQQILLINESKIVDCDVWGDTKYLRRALIIKEDKYSIAESYQPVSIKEFQESLRDIGVTDAVYLDMGTWSEGWFQDCQGKFIKIGRNMKNTDKQTNWIVFTINE